MVDGFDTCDLTLFLFYGELRGGNDVSGWVHVVGVTGLSPNTRMWGWATFHFGGRDPCFSSSPPHPLPILIP